MENLFNYSKLDKFSQFQLTQKNQKFLYGGDIPPDDKHPGPRFWNSLSINDFDFSNFSDAFKQLLQSFFNNYLG
jgi:hypothetical protein